MEAHLLARDEHGAFDLRAVRVLPDRTIGFDDAAMAADPGGVLLARGKAPGALHPVAARDHMRIAGTIAPGKHATRIAPDRARRGGVEISRREGATRALAQHPAGRAIGRGDGLQQAKELRRPDFFALVDPRQQGAEDGGAMHGVQHLGRQALFRFNPRRRRFNHRGKDARD